MKSSSSWFWASTVFSFLMRNRAMSSLSLSRAEARSSSILLASRTARASSRSRLLLHAEHAVRPRVLSGQFVLHFPQMLLEHEALVFDLVHETVDIGLAQSCKSGHDSHGRSPFYAV